MDSNIVPNCASTSGDHQQCACVTPSGQEYQRQHPALPDTWSQNEANFNKAMTLTEGAVVFQNACYTANSRAEVLTNIFTNETDHIKKLYAQCFNGSNDLISNACAIIDSNPKDVGTWSKSKIDAGFKFKIMGVELAMTKVAQYPDINENSKNEIMSIARAVITMLIKFNDMLLTFSMVESTKLAVAAGALTSDVEALWRYMSDENSEPLNPMQRLYQIVIERARKLEYSRYKNSFMRRVVTKDGFITNAWEHVAKFDEFIYGLTKIPDSEIYSLTTKTRDIMENVACLIAKRLESQVPWIEPDRHVFAFSNGCYLAKIEYFIKFSKEAPPMMPDGQECPTACKYHDVPIDINWLRYPDPMSIPTPIMSHIMDTQCLSPDVKRVYFSMLGRSIYELNEMDNWQVFLFVKGNAETGKSTLLKFIASFYGIEDVGILSNNIEATFGASMIADKFVVVGDDLGENLSLDQQLFQNMCSGNDVSLPRKNTSALTIRWKAQLLLSGNVVPGYKDNAGSFSRRLLIVHYSKVVRHVDPTLPNRLKNEIGAAIIKCNRCYRNMIRRLSSMFEDPINPTTFWDAIPEQFRTQRRNIMQCANAFMSFFNSGVLVFGRSLYMKKRVFVENLMNHCQANGIPKPRFQPVQYEGSFAIMELEMTHTRQKRKYPNTPGGVEMTDIWILGCDLATTESIASATADSIRVAEAVDTGQATAVAPVTEVAAVFRQSHKRPIACLTNTTMTSDSPSLPQRPRLL